MRGIDVRTGLGLALTLLASAAGGQGSAERGVLVTAKEAVQLLSPELIAAPGVNRIWYSPDERYALLERSTVRWASGIRTEGSALYETLPGSETSLVLWDARLRAAREVWSFPDPIYIGQVDWLPSSGFALVQVEKLPAPQESRFIPLSERKPLPRTHLLLRVTPGESRAQTLAQVEYEDYDPFEYGLSPIRSLAVLLTRERVPLSSNPSSGDVREDPDHPGTGFRQTLYLVGEKGGPKRSRVQPARLGELPVRWTTEGLPLLDLPILEPNEREYKRVRYLLDPHTFDLVPVASEPILAVEKPAPPKPPPSLQVVASRVTVKEKEASEDRGALWLEQALGSPGARTLICTDCSEGRMLGRDLIVYRSHGAVWAVPLLHTTPAALAEWRRQAEKRAALSNAENFTSNLIWEVMRNRDGVFPAPQDVFGALGEIIHGDPSEFYKDYHYTFPGGKLPVGQKPETVQIGFYSSPSGRVLIFADGHVTWTDG